MTGGPGFSGIPPLIERRHSPGKPAFKHTGALLRQAFSAREEGEVLRNMIKRARLGAGILGLACLASGAVWLGAQTKPSAEHQQGSGPGREKVVQYLRERFGLPANVKLTVGPYRPSFDPNLLEATVTVDDGKQKKEQKILVGGDGRHLIVGEVYDLAADPRAAALRIISTRNQPSQGPATAPVTIVEYADLECPMCARLHEFFENELLPKYSGKVRIVFKDFPLVAIHDWADTASLASQCAYETSPQEFVAYRSLIFRNQSAITASNARDMLLNLAAKAGIDSLKLAACLDRQASRPRVEQNLEEGKKFGVASTPTCYVNGKLVVGFSSPDDYYTVVEELINQATR
jgi:protein-disulfide isomerase